MVSSRGLGDVYKRQDVREEAGPHRLHAEDAGLARRGDDLSRLVGGGREGLLDEDVLAGADRQQRVLEVLAVRAGHVDRVDIGVGDEVGIAAVGPGIGHVLVDETLGSLQVARPDRHDGLGGAPQGDRQLRGDPTGACLLYTSDAADDTR